MYHPNQKDRNFCLRVCVYYNTTRDRNERTIAVALRDDVCVCALKLYVQLFPIVLPIVLPTPRHQDLLSLQKCRPLFVTSVALSFHWPHSFYLQWGIFQRLLSDSGFVRSFVVCQHNGSSLLCGIIVVGIIE
jgi:hypothetical protein